MTSGVLTCNPVGGSMLGPPDPRSRENLLCVNNSQLRLAPAIAGRVLADQTNVVNSKMKQNEAESEQMLGQSTPPAPT